MRQALRIGFLFGVLLSLAGLYPAVGLIAPVLLPAWEPPLQNELLHGLVLMISAGIFIPLFFSVGLVAARRANAVGWKSGAKVGAVAGLITGLFLYTTLISPLSSLAPYTELAPFSPTAEMPFPPVEALREYVTGFSNTLHFVDITLLFSALFWGVGGALYGWRAGDGSQAEKRSLHHMLRQEIHPRAWFADNESTIRAGLWVGTIFGVLLFTAVFGQFYVGFTADWPELADAIRDTQTGVFVTGPLQQALPLLWPLTSIGLLVYGGVVVFLAKDPANMVGARYRGIWAATVIILLLLFAVVLRIIYFNMGLAPFGLFHWMEANPDILTDLPEEMHSAMDAVMFLRQPLTLIGVAFILPWVGLLLTLVLSVLYGGVQTLIFVPTVAFFYKRPVDKASTVQRRWQREPENLLPQLYALFEEPEAYAILAHLVRRTYDNTPEISRLCAAYHTLGQSQRTDDYLAATADIQSILNAHQEEWRWAADLGGVYRALHQVLAARTLEQILAIDRPAEQQTTSLPPVILQCVQRVSRIIGELHKVNQVEDISTQIIFLENGLELIHEAQRFVDRSLGHEDESTATLPEYAALTNVLDHWQGVVLGAIRRLKGRADVVSSLQSKQCTLANTLPLVWEVTNQGVNVAQQVRLQVLPGDEYYLKEEETAVAILPPGETEMMTLPIHPRDGASRLRVEWKIIYDDAVDEKRERRFADVVEFVTPNRPFQRIFPIPYVTGTPLKTDDVFVGRQDVFDFIRENLVGAHQNNVIILHGQRRTGKTSVLYRLRQVMAETHFAVLVDMQGKPARGEADFLFSIADDIVFALEDHEIVVDLPERADFEEEGPEFFFRSRFLRGLRPHLDGKHLLLMFDEFEELQRRVEDGRLQPEIFQFLRNLMQHEEYVDFVFSGTHKLEDLGAEYWSVLFNIAAYKPITFLSPSEMERLIGEPVADYNLEYDSLAVDRIITVTAGHPYFAQLVLHEMIVYHNETRRSYLTVADVDQVLERIVERGEAHFKYIWAESSPEEQAVLSGFTELLMGERKTASAVDLRALLEERGLESEDRWATALANLEGRDILTRQSSRTNLYRFKVDLIRLWIERTRPPL